MAAVSPRDIRPVMGCFQSSLSIWLPTVHRTWTELCRKILLSVLFLGWPRSPSGWSSLQPDVDRLEKINPRKCLLIQFHPSTSYGVIFLVRSTRFSLNFLGFFMRKSTKIFHVQFKSIFLKYFPGKNQRKIKKTF